MCTRCYHYLCKYINNGEDLVTKIIAKNDEIMLTASVSLNVMRWKYFSILNKFSKTVKRGNVHDDLTALVTMIKLKQTISIWLNYRKQILSLENSWKIFFFFFSPILFRPCEHEIPWSRFFSFAYEKKCFVLLWASHRNSFYVSSVNDIVNKSAVVAASFGISHHNHII